MAKIVNGTRVVTNEVRLSYAHVINPNTDDNGNLKYSVSILIPKNDAETLKLIDEAVNNAFSKWGDKLGKKPTNINSVKHPINDGDVDRDDPVYAGHYYINCNSKFKPTVIDTTGRELTSEDDVYSGCYGKVSINFYCYNNRGNKGVAAGLANVMKTRDGEKLSKGYTAIDDFDLGEIPFN